MFPIEYGVAGFVFFFGGNGIWLAHHLLWRRTPALFWLVTTLIVVAIGYLVATGAAESIARAMWPVAFDEVRSKEILLRTSCEEPRLFATVVVLAPVMLVLVPLMLKEKRSWLRILVSVGFTLFFFAIYISPIPGKLAPLIGLEDKLPDHCRQTNQQGHNSVMHWRFYRGGDALRITPA